MSCISSNFSSFFLNSLNDPSEFSKYLSNGELRFSSTFEDFQVYGQNNVQQQQQQQHYQQQQQQQHHINGELISCNGDEGNSNIENTQPIVTSVQHYGSYQNQHTQSPHHQQQQQMQQQQTRWALPHHQQHATQNQQNLPPNSHASVTAVSGGVSSVPTGVGGQHFDGSFEFMKYLRHSNDYTDNSHDASGPQNQTQSSHTTAVGTKPEASLNNGLMDLDNAHKRATARKTPVLSSVNSNHHNSNSSHPTPMDIYDHDSKHNIYDLHHMNSVHSSNSNESSMELSSMNYPNSHLNASNSNTSSEGGNTQNHSDFSMLSGVANSQNSNSATAVSTATAGATAAAASPAAPKPLASFTIKDNFEAHPSHKVEEGIFQHMNKLPSKKKDNLKQLGVRFTGQMTLNDKSIIVENFIKFCQEYDIKDHRPFLSLNQSGLNKPDQIKFARYLGQGLPTFTLFCIYSNFKNLFCTKRTEVYTKDGYNLPYILDKIKRFLANTTADLKNIINNQSNDSMDFLTNVPTVPATTTPITPMMNPMGNNLNSLPPPLLQQQQQQQITPILDFNQATTTTNQLTQIRPLENLMIYENFDVHETHRIEDGICTQMARLPPKKQELLKQFGIQTNQTVTYYEKYIIIENFNRFCNEYKVADHRPFLDLQENGLPKSEQLKFIRYLGQGLPNLTLSKIYLVFKDLLGLSRIEKMALDGYNLDAILKKKKKNLYNRMTAAAVHKECHPEAIVPTPPSTTISTTPAQSNSTPLMPLYPQDAYKT
ncbi:uncharacterized protein ACRADG_001627 isoform 2-T4 [Cochliomyia hominivorax]